MANTIISPNRYVQGRGELKNLPEHAKKLGKKLFVIISASGLKRVRDLLEKSFENTGMELVFEEFQGECCETEIKRLGSRFQENKCDLVVGVGGGKIHDSAKAAAYYQGAPVLGHFFGFTGLCWINPIAWVTASGLLFLSYRKTMRNIRPVDPTVDASDSNKIMN